MTANISVVSVLGEHAHDGLQRLGDRLLHVWMGSSPDFLGREPRDIDAVRFLGFEIELGPEEGIHQQSYIYGFLQETLDPECLKDRRTRRTPREPQSFSHKQPDPVHAQKARLKHPPLQAGQDPLEHTPILHLVGVLLWISLRTRRDIAWAVARISIGHIVRKRFSLDTTWQMLVNFVCLGLWVAEFCGNSAAALCHPVPHVIFASKIHISAPKISKMRIFRRKPCV